MTIAFVIRKIRSTEEQFMDALRSYGNAECKQGVEKLLTNLGQCDGLAAYSVVGRTVDDQELGRYFYAAAFVPNKRLLDFAGGDGSGCSAPLCVDPADLMRIQ